MRMAEQHVRHIPSDMSMQLYSRNDKSAAPFFSDDEKHRKKLCRRKPKGSGIGKTQGLNQGYMQKFRFSIEEEKLKPTIAAPLWSAVLGQLSAGIGTSSASYLHTWLQSRTRQTLKK